MKKKEIEKRGEGGRKGWEGKLKKKFTWPMVIETQSRNYAIIQISSKHNCERISKHVLNSYFLVTIGCGCLGDRESNFEAASHKSRWLGAEIWGSHKFTGWDMIRAAQLVYLSDMGYRNLSRIIFAARLGRDPLKKLFPKFCQRLWGREELWTRESRRIKWE